MGVATLQLVWLAVSMLAVCLVGQAHAAGIMTASQPGDLNDYLCGAGASSITNGTTLELSEDTVHVITGKSCVWQNKADLVVQGAGEKMAKVVCNGSDYSTTGIVFSGMNNITFRNIWFENCGGSAENASDIIAPVNSTSPRQAVELNQPAVLFLSQCRDVVIENVTFTNYRGYAAYVINMMGSSYLQNVVISDSYVFKNRRSSTRKDKLKYSGSGAFFHFSDDLSLPDTNTNVQILNSNFTNNFNLYPDYLIQELKESRLQNLEKEFPLYGAGGLTVHFEQQNQHVTVEIRDTDFRNNHGTAGGGGCRIASRNTVDKSNLNISGCTFLNNGDFMNSDLFPGGGLSLNFIFYYSELRSINKPATEQSYARFVIENSEFRGNKGKMGAAMAMFTEAQNVSMIKVHVKNVSFIENEATEDGDCILVESENAATYSEKGPELTLESISVVHDGKENELDTTAALSFNNIFVTINGTHQNPTKISNGKNGGLKLFNTYATLTGEVQFINNSATKGGAITMEANSYLFYREPANVLFSGNRAITYGGAIYSDMIRGRQCAMQFIAPDRGNATIQNSTRLQELNFSIRFIDNTADDDGDAIYAEPILNCVWFSESIVQVPGDNIPDVFKTFLFFQAANGTELRYRDQLTNHPYIPSLCEVTDSSILDHVINKTLTLSTHPGSQFSIAIIPFDKASNPVKSVVEAQLLDDFNGSLYFDGNKRRVVNELRDKTCSSQRYTLHSTLENVSVDATIKLSIPGRAGEFIKVVVHLEKCPFGFQLNKTTGACECVQLFTTNRIECDVETTSFNKPETHYWIGETQLECGVPACVVKCPNGFCKRSKEVNLASLFNQHCNTSSVENTTPYYDGQCQGGRVGEMCGKCAQGKSLQFGTTECKECSNYWLFTIILYILAGLALVVTLFLLKLTISDGLLGTILFYVQLFSINIGLLVSTDETRFTTVFISLLNLELGFPICFFDGMDQPTKYGLQFVFPIYIWLIVGLITIASRYSDRLAKLVGTDCSKVFVTLIYFSYTKLLRTSTDVFVYATIETDTNNTYYVWFYDGGEKYFDKHHLILGLVSIFFLVFILTPYMLFTLFCHLLLQVSWISRRFKPLIDATLAPYKDRWRFWFGLRLLIINLLILISVSVASLSTDAVTYSHIVIITLFIVFQVNVKPFKSKIVHYLDLFFLINYVLFLIGCLFIFDVLKPTPANQKSYIAGVEVVLLGSAFTVFSLTILCHVVLRVRKFYGERRGGEMKLTQQTEEENGTEMAAALHSTQSSDEHRRRTVSHTVVGLNGREPDDGASLRESLLEDY